MSRLGQRWDWARLSPCGTPAAARRHYRHGEKPCAACLQANSRATQDWKAARDKLAAGRRRCGCVMDPVVFGHLGCRLSPPKHERVDPCPGGDCFRQHYLRPDLAKMAALAKLIRAGAR